MKTTKKAITLSYVQVIAEVVESHGGNKAELLEKACIKASSLNQFFEFISLQQYELILSEAIKMANKPDLGLSIGSELKFGSHGTFAYAALSFPTAWDAMIVGQKFSRLCNRVVDIRMLEVGDYNVVRIETPYFTGSLYQTVIEIVVGTFCEIFKLKFSQALSAIEIDFRYGKPAYGDRYFDVFDPAIKFEADANEIRIPRHIAEAPLAMADPGVASRFEKECDELISSMGEQRDIVDLVRQALFISKGGFPQLDEMASQLNMSSRTLRRKLQYKETSFKKILDEVRFEIAKRYLLTTNRSIGEIAHILGYEDQNSFSHAFKVISSLPPTQFRAKNGG